MSSTCSSVAHFVVHIHGACIHPYTGGLQEIQLNGEYSAQDDDGKWILLLLHPRWCPDCLKRRTKAISKVCKEKRAKLNSSGRGKDHIRVECAHLDGLKDGRIQALSLPFEDVPKSDKEVNALDDLMGGMSVEEKTVDDLADLMAQQNIVECEVTADWNRYLLEQEARELGVKEGKAEQSKNEDKAMFADVDKREELFKLALD